MADKVSTGVAPESDPAHPKHRKWLARAANAALDMGVLIITAGRVHLAPGSVTVKPEDQAGPTPGAGGGTGE